MDEMILKLAYRNVLDMSYRNEYMCIQVVCGNWNDSIHAGHLLLRQVHNGYTSRGAKINKIVLRCFNRNWGS